MKKNKKSINNPISLRFSPTAWAKVLFLRDYGDTEVGGFAITPSDNLLFVEDLRLVGQAASWTHVAFDDSSVADFFDAQVDAGRQPEQFARIWVHTHPGDCPRPSRTDKETFRRVFGRSDWALMFILACEGQTYARLQFHVGPGGAIEIPVEADYSRPFAGCDVAGWEQEYLANVRPQEILSTAGPSNAEPVFGSPFEEDPFEEWYDSWVDYTDQEETERGPIP